MYSSRAWGAGVFIAVSHISLFSIPARCDDTATVCCAHLEELVSGLRAALSRDENSERAVRIYGQLNRAIMYWDDGKKSAAFAVDNETSSSRLGLMGTHPFLGELSAGYRVEIDSRVTSSSEVSSGDPWRDLGDGAIRLRHAYWYVENSKLGRLTFGQQSPATDDITIISLGARMSDAALHVNNNHYGI